MVLNIGIVGAGGFAQFAATAFLKVTGIKIVAVMDINEALARQMAAEFGAAVYVDYKMILTDKNIDLVYIATPPFLHFEQSKMALMAGKHVICEKPAALRVTEAEELRILATCPQRFSRFHLNALFSFAPGESRLSQIVGQESGCTI